VMAGERVRPTDLAEIPSLSNAAQTSEGILLAPVEASSG
jgi:hypothetical protein